MTIRNLGIERQNKQPEVNFKGIRVYMVSRKEDKKSTVIVYNNLDGEPKYEAQDCDCGIDNSTLNLGALLESVLEQVIDMTEEDFAKMSVKRVLIYAPGFFVDMITAKEHLDLMELGIDKYDANRVISDEEKEMWQCIEDMICELGSKIAFKDIGRAQLANNRRRFASPIEQLDNDLQQLAWERLPGGNRRTQEIADKIVEMQ